MPIALAVEGGTIAWVGPREDAVRPTGPFDPELPVLALTRPDGTPEAVLFNHSTHTIGAAKAVLDAPPERADEVLAPWLRRSREGSDVREGLAAFLEGRPARF